MIERTRLYTLCDRDPVPCHDIRQWSAFMVNFVRWTIVNRHHFGRWGEINTRFSGIDHEFDGKASQPYHRPKLWYTAITGGPLDGYHERYDSFGAAVMGHKLAVRAVKRHRLRQAARRGAMVACAALLALCVTAAVLVADNIAACDAGRTPIAGFCPAAGEVLK